MNYIFVKEAEFVDYTVKSNFKNRIRIFWKTILKDMSKSIYDEVVTKMTDLVLQNKGEFEINGAVPYQFETKNASQKLKEYLDQYAVFVEKDTNQTHKWRENMQEVKAKIHQNI